MSKHIKLLRTSAVGRCSFDKIEVGIPEAEAGFVGFLELMINIFNVLSLYLLNFKRC